MKTSKIRTLWIFFLSALYTINACTRSILMQLTGSTSRLRVDNIIEQWINRLLKVAGIRCNIENPHKVMPVEGQATIIMCNHSSIYDIPLSYKAFPQHSIRMLAKKELSRIPVLGSGMKAAEFPFIDRKNRHQAYKDLEYVRQLMESGIVIWIAPEGTRSKTGKIASFKKGAFITAIQSKATIIPMGIRGAHAILPAHSMQFNLNQTAEIHIGKSFDASKYTMENKEELVNLVHQSIRELAGEI